MFFQVSYKEEVESYLDGKEHVSDGMGTDQFLYFILILCVLFFIISIGMSAFMLIRRHRKNIKKEFDNALIAKYQDFLSGFLVLPVDDAFLGIQKQDGLEYRLQLKDISDPYRRKILASEIYELKKNLSGQQEVQLTNYFFGLGLQNEVGKMMNSRYWTEKVKAMQMIKVFNILEYQPLVIEYINSKNRELAIHAICVIMSLNKSTEILFEIQQILNNWECHKIVEVIKELKINTAHDDKLLQAIKKKDSPLGRLSFGLLEKEPGVFALN